jgi:hypothetical protein
MPVTFQTDLRDLKDFGYVQQVPLEALFKNLGYKQAKFDQSAQQIQRQTDALVVDALGQDVAVRDQILKQVDGELSKYAGADLSDSNVSSQLSGFIGKVSKDPALLGAQARSDMYTKMMKDQHDAEMKGKVWINEGLEDAQKYYSSGQFDPNARFQDKGFEAPDLEKALEEIAKGTPEWEEWKKNGNYNEHTKEKSIEQLYSRYKQAFENDPKLSRYFEYLYKKEHGGDDANIFFDNHQKLLTDVIPNLNPVDQAAAIAQLNQLEGMRGTPAGRAAARNYVKDLWYQNQAFTAADAKHYVNTVDKKADEFVLAAQNDARDHANRMEEAKYTAWLQSGAQVDANGEMIINPTENRDGATPSTYTVTGKDGKTSTVNLHPNIAAYYQYVHAAKQGPNTPIPNVAQTQSVDLSKNKFWGGSTGPQGKWFQLDDASLIEPLLAKSSSTITGSGVSTTSQENLSYYEGKPAVFINRKGEIIYGVNSGAGVSGGVQNERKEDIKFRSINSGEVYGRTLRSHASAADKKLIDASMKHGNIYDKGAVQQGNQPQQQQQQPQVQIKPGFVRIQLPGHPEGQIPKDSVASFMASNPTAKVIK